MDDHLLDDDIDLPNDLATHEYGTFLFRILALVIDWACIYIILLPLRLFTFNNVIYPLMIITVIIYCYFTFQEMSKRSATIGKYFLKLDVHNRELKEITLRESLTRTTLKFIPLWIYIFSILILDYTWIIGRELNVLKLILMFRELLPFVAILLFVIGCYTIIKDPYSRGLHDKIAGTTVLRKIKDTE